MSINKQTVRIVNSYSRPSYMFQLCSMFIIIFVLSFSSLVVAQQKNKLKVGAAKVDISAWAESQEDIIVGIHDPVYSRAIVIDNGTSKAVLVSVDVGGISEATWKSVGKQIKNDMGIPVENLILSATHTHSMPFTLPNEEFAKYIVESI